MEWDFYRAVFWWETHVREIKSRKIVSTWYRVLDHGLIHFAAISPPPSSFFVCYLDLR